MGREAICNAQLGDARSKGKALLETSDLTFRGDFRVTVPFKAIKTLKADGAALRIKWPGGLLTLELGADTARTWADKIKNPPNRLDKLGVTAEKRLTVVGKLDADFLQEVKQRGARVEKAPKAPVDLVFFAADSRSDLPRLRELAKTMAADGALWVIRPKGSAAISEREVMEAGKAAGLVDVKVAAFSPTHTAEKFVVPVARRPRQR